MTKDHIYHPPIPQKPQKQTIDGQAITPARAVRLSEECETSKGYDSDELVNEQAAGDDKYCRWVLMAFPKGEWAKFKAWLVDFEKYGADILGDLMYYRGVTKAINDKDETPKQ